MAAQEKNEVQRRDPQRGGLLRRGGYDPWFTANPFSMMRQMSEEMNRFFGDRAWGFSEHERGWMPAVEVSERDNKYVVHAELPGLKPEDVKVSVEDGSLVLEGERKYEHEDEKGGVRRTERRYGKFYRSVPLPEGVNLDQVKAKFDNGVLEIAVPVPEQAANSGRRQIQIEAGSTGSSGGRKAA